MIVGVTKGYSKKLRLVGVGYRALLDKEKIIFKLGYSHEVNFTIPEDVSMMPSKAKGTLLLIKGIELGRVNQIASEIRGLREPDVYKGKGVQYYNEILKLKKGKREGK
jgi:large subunit ribosomal protein L6